MFGTGLTIRRGNLRTAYLITFIYSTVRSVMINWRSSGAAPCAEVNFVLIVLLLGGVLMAMQDREELKGKYPDRLFPPIEWDLPAKGNRLKSLGVSVLLSLAGMILSEMAMRLIIWMACSE